MKIGQTDLVKTICLFLCFFKGDLDFLRLEALAFLFLSPVLPDCSICEGAGSPFYVCILKLFSTTYYTHFTFESGIWILA